MSFDENRFIPFATLVALACLNLASIGLPLEAQADKSARTLIVDDMNDIKDVWGPQISPDGLWVAYTITEVDAHADVKRSDIWLTHWDGSRVESRINAAVLNVGGLDDTWGFQPEEDAFNFVTRVSTPVLMINGEFDIVAPVRNFAATDV